MRRPIPILPTTCMSLRECNAAYFLDKSRLIEPATHEVIEAVLKSPLFIQQSYKSCHGILRLAIRFGNDRLEYACLRIKPVSSANYTRLKNILEHGLDSIPLSNGDTSYIPANDDVRGPIHIRHSLVGAVCHLPAE